jgi:hypothetical protein
MSRKRDVQREKTRALAQQLGTKDADKVGALIARPRVANIVVRPGKLLIEKRPHGLFARGEAHVVLALCLASPDGVQTVASGVFIRSTEHDSAGLMMPLDDDSWRAVSKVRISFHRPAHLTLVGALVAKEREARALADALAAAPPRVAFDGELCALDDATLTRHVGRPARACTFVVEGSRAARVGAACLFPAAGTGKHDVTLALASDDGAWATLATVHILE